MDAPETGIRCEFKTYHTIPKKNGELETKTITEPFGPVSRGDGDTPFALVIHRKFTDKYELESTSLTVNSPHLLEVFRNVVGTGYTTVASDFSSPFELSSPFQILMHYVSPADTLLCRILARRAHHIIPGSGTSSSNTREKPGTASNASI